MNFRLHRYPQLGGSACMRRMWLLAGLLTVSLFAFGYLAAPASAQLPDIDIPGDQDDDDKDNDENDNEDDDTPDLPDLPDNPLDDSPSGGGSGGSGGGGGGGSDDGGGGGGGGNSSDNNNSGPRPLGSTFESVIVTAPIAPLRLAPFPIVRIRGTIVRGGVSLQIVSVFGPADASIEALCTGRGCPTRRQVRSAAASSAPRLVRFPSLEHRFLPTGTRLRFKVLKPGSIGKYTRFTIRTNRVPLRGDLCMLHGARAPMRCPGG